MLRLFIARSILRLQLRGIRSSSHGLDTSFSTHGLIYGYCSEDSRQLSWSPGLVHLWILGGRDQVLRFCLEVLSNMHSSNPTAKGSFHGSAVSPASVGRARSRRSDDPLTLRKRQQQRLDLRLILLYAANQFNYSFESMSERRFECFLAFFRIFFTSLRSRHSSALQYHLASFWSVSWCLSIVKF